MSHREMESLPKQFVLAMRTLFDIMDDKRTGYVKLTDIENRWRYDRTKGLPRGVIESLQKVASHDGLLTFEHFCSGLKICLLRNQVDNSLNSHSSTRDDLKQYHSLIDHRPPSAPILDLDGIGHQRNWESLKITDSSVGPAAAADGALQLLARQEARMQEVHRTSIELQKQEHLDRLYQSGPPKPPRLEKNIPERSDLTLESNKSYIDLTLREGGKPDELGSVEKKNRGHGDGRPDSESMQAHRKTRRREPRRHTLHNGVDYNLLKRMKQIEQEKDVLLQGLAAVEDAREWYLKQLAEVQEKMRSAGRVGAYVEPWNSAQQERLELLRVRVTELNRQLRALAAPATAGGRAAFHMNLALPTPQPPPTDLSTVEPSGTNILRTQNRMLVEEVNKRNEKISVLECEKSSLIRELLLQRSRNKVNNFH